MTFTIPGPVQNEHEVLAGVRALNDRLEAELPPLGPHAPVAA